jgi:flagellar hook-basal body complex protein FliE
MSALPPISSTAASQITGPQASSQVNSQASPQVNSQVNSPASLQPTAADGSPDRNVFVDLLSQANQDQLRSEQAIEGLVSGENQDVQQVVMEVVKAEMSFQVFMEVRNKIIESYNELMRMQF